MEPQRIECPACGEKFLYEVRRPWYAGGVYVTIGYRNGAAVNRLRRVIQMLQEAADDLPFRPDLAEAVQLLHQIDTQLTVVVDP
jgi:hypothetical protein